MNDIALMEQLNNQLQKPLKQRDKLTWFLKGYRIDSEGRVIELNLFDARLNGHIPEEVFQLQHLEHLDIRSNDLTHLPDSVQNLRQLRFLDARQNRLNKLPEGFKHLDCLEKLYLGHNRFSAVPACISTLESLWLIDLIENEITRSCEYLLDAPMLTNIYLKNNQISHFPFDRISACLDELNLNENPLNLPPAFHHPLINHMIV